MKRLLLLLGCAAAFSSCLKNDRYNQGVTYPGYQLYTSVLNQNIVTLDPFNVAYRLNVLITEGNGDFNAAPDPTKKKLFSSGTTIAYDETNSTYNLTFNSSTLTGDYPRKGTLYVRTNGFDSLDMAGAQWDVWFSSPFAIISESKSIEITCPSYTITNQGDNSWNVSTSQYVAKLPLPNTSNPDVELKSNWSATYSIKQKTGSQTLADIKKTIFTINTNVISGTTMYLPENKVTVQTPTPFQYNPNCSAYAPVGNGLMYITLLDDLDPNTNFTQAQIMGGDQTNVCSPKVKITYQNQSTEY